MGTTVIVVTHEHDLVSQFDGRVIRLEAGEIVSDSGALEEHPVEEYDIDALNF